MRDILEHFEGVRSVGDAQWEALCPAHEDRNASLAIGYRNSRWLVSCHAGCGYGSILLAADPPLEVADLFDDGERPSGGVTLRPEPPPARERAVRDVMPTVMPPMHVLEHWQSQIGEIADRLYELKGWTLPTLQRLGVGFDGSRVVFPVVSPGGRLVAYTRYKPGGKPKTLSVGERLLWPDPRTIDAEHVWLVEGEADRVSMCELGFRAVALPGVGKWRDDWSGLFADTAVTVCLDCDDEGRAASERIVKQLRAAGVNARSVDLAPNRTDGFDITEALTGALQRDGHVTDLIGYLNRLKGTS